MKSREDLLKYAERYYCDHDHTLQVLKLAELLFNCLSPLHSLDRSHLVTLQSAAILHDIGLQYGPARHHKSSAQIMLADPPPLEDPSALYQVACIARYHRKALPDTSHDIYKTLPSGQRAIVQKLAALLRLADGLDYMHTSCVDTLFCTIGNNKVKIEVVTRGDCKRNIEQALKKSDLFKQIYGREVLIQLA